MTLPNPTRDRFRAYQEKAGAESLAPFLADYGAGTAYEDPVSAVAGLLDAVRHYCAARGLDYQKASDLSADWFEAECQEDPRDGP